MTNDLHAFIPRLQAQTFHGQSDEQLRAYLRIYTALYELVTVNALDAEYGDRQQYLHQIEQLYQLLQEQTAQHPTAQNHSTLLEISDRYAAYSTAIANRDPWESAADYVETYSHQSGDPHTVDHYITLRLIQQLWSGVEPIDGEPDSSRYYREQLQSWKNTQQPNGMWDHLTTAETLGRLVILHQETREDPRQRKALRPLFIQQVHTYIEELQAQTPQHVTAQLSALLFLYDQLLQSPFVEFDQPLHALLQIIETQQDHLAPDSPQSFALTAILLERHCHTVAAQVQHTALHLQFA